MPLPRFDVTCRRCLTPVWRTCPVVRHARGSRERGSPATPIARRTRVFRGPHARNRLRLQWPRFGATCRGAGRAHGRRPLNAHGSRDPQRPARRTGVLCVSERVGIAVHAVAAVCRACPAARRARGSRERGGAPARGQVRFVAQSPRSGRARVAQIQAVSESRVIQADNYL